MIDKIDNIMLMLQADEGDVVLSAMTSGIRTNWMQAIQKCLETHATSPPQAWTHTRVNIPNTRTVSMPERGITHPAFTQNSQDGDNHLAQSYPAPARNKSKIKDTRVMPIGQESKNLDLGAGLNKDKAKITRRQTLDDYSSMSHRFNSEESLDRVGSQESLHSVTSEGSQGHSSSSQPVKRRRRRDKQHKHRISCTWPNQSADGISTDTTETVAMEIKSSESGKIQDMSFRFSKLPVIKKVIYTD